MQTFGYMKASAQYRTVIISDLHLGTENSKATEVVAFLKTISCKKLILNGDIIDGWQLRERSIWKKRHTAFFRVVLRMIEKQHTKVIYLRGNHDDFLDQIIPFRIGKNFIICRDYILKSGNRKFYVTHGDVFDSITSRLKWLAHIGDIGYTLLLSINKFYNRYRHLRGLPYYSLSQQIKQKVKQAVNYISDFEEKLAELAKANDCEGVICGHIHRPEMRQINDILYLNSGDWVESMSALTEDFDGNWALVYFALPSDQTIDIEEPIIDEFEDDDAIFLNTFLHTA
jgi:UDP-2,3-diacylglucosamine pyrophosphatase LpxH